MGLYIHVFSAVVGYGASLGTNKNMEALRMQVKGNGIANSDEIYYIEKMFSLHRRRRTT